MPPHSSMGTDLPSRAWMRSHTSEPRIPRRGTAQTVPYVSFLNTAAAPITPAVPGSFADTI
jgi:hypothetical protein